MSTAEVGAAVSGDVAPLGAAAGVLEGAGVDVRPAGSVGVTGGTAVSVAATAAAPADTVTEPPVNVAAMSPFDGLMRLDGGSLPVRLMDVVPGAFAWNTTWINFCGADVERGEPRAITGLQAASAAALVPMAATLDALQYTKTSPPDSQPLSATDCKSRISGSHVMMTS